MIKKHRGCIDCGYAAHAVALQFDHIGDKRMNVSDMIRSDYGWETIKAEIDKCEVRCANCHSVVTAQRKASEKSRLPFDEATRFPAVVEHLIDEAYSIHASSLYSLPSVRQFYPEHSLVQY